MKEPKNFYMPIFFDDWIGGTYSMSSAARGVYIMLVIALAKQEKVPAKIEYLRRLGGELTNEQYEEVIAKCRIVDGFIVNDKVNKIMAAIHLKQIAGRRSIELKNKKRTVVQHNTQHNA
ncbi:Protein of unknown function DUF1376 [uncultured Caudovirales phage]|uniref:Uncharacterized protein n=1 Tax=uncultured Caudovirales phage TaxID=2100421 RepID=A0A6J5SNX4_9CAUD|nr:Protein of unknown function DUF1376 [uncultured Caudovirales phage]CAB4203998.1 Protein of unknown function DUF1376 [uncultured Caudovirales phage]CAB4215648.1 Protein of unknown function DUF1376 [uncultured Caudovirales phage]CAB5229818.1 Protein of unknown function DUF1376 [uncultured Caudovirales phage]